MPLTAESADRYAALQARIDAARQRLAEGQKMEWAEIGTILEGISEELEGIDDHPEAEKPAAYDRLEGKLDAIHGQLDSARPTD